jgi:hypothetical protein
MKKELRLPYKPVLLPRVLFCLIFTAFCFTAGYGQTVTGTVSNTDGDHLTGVTVKVKGNNNGTSTDADGKYSINLVGKTSLVFSSVGYTTQEVPVNGRTVIDVSLARDQRNLDEVVVTALGIKK